MIFRKIHGRIVPILEKHPTATGVGMLFGATMAAKKVREKTAEKIKGKGKKSFGALSNVVADIGISGGIMYGAYKYGGNTSKRSIEALSAFMKRSLKGY